MATDGRPRPMANLVIAGVTKGGTTALLHYLSQHPDVCGERHKESSLLLRDDMDPAEVRAAYQEQFSHCRDEPWKLESSPAYFARGPSILLGPGGASEDLHVLIVLRDPVERLWSAYRMKRVKGRVAPDSFDDFVSTGLHGRGAGHQRLYEVFDTNRYASVLRPWLEEFDQRCRVIFFEDLAADTAGTLRDVLLWLDLDPSPVDGFDLSVHNRGVQHRRDAVRAVAAWVNRILAVPLRRAPSLRSGLLRAYERINTTEVPEEMTTATRSFLRDAYRNDVRTLRHVLCEHGYESFPSWVPDEHPATVPPERSTE